MTHRTCFRCKRSLEATSTNFHREKSRPLGLSYECKECHNSRKKGRDRRTDRWVNISADKRNMAKASNKRYSRTDRGSAVFLRNAYQRVDACDLTSKEIYELIVQPCVYCGTTENPRGLDRIDNALPHVKGNVRPACAPCNFARGDRFTASEMDIIAAAIRQVMEARKVQG